MEDKEQVSHAVIQIELKHLQKDVEELKQNQKQILTELSRYKGMVGGIMLMMTAISAAIGLAFEWFKTRGH